MKSLYQLHKEKYQEGCGSEHCSKASKIVFARGNIPCDILFIGEAPGENENTHGVPFIGPAGKVMDDIIRRSIPHQRSFVVNKGDTWQPEISYALTNLVCCIPRERKDGKLGKVGAPEPEQVACCKERLEEFIRICRPKLIVCVGTVSRDYVMHQGYKHSCKVPEGVKVMDIIHPGYFFKNSIGVVQRGFLIQRAVVTIQDAIEDAGI